MNEAAKNKVGRPFTSQRAIQEVVSKLEPYLCSGLSLRKACREAKVSRAWVYTLMARDENFADQIARFQQHLSVIVCGILAKELFRIVIRQQKGKGISSSDRDFLWWFALHSTLTAEEYGRRKNVTNYNPEFEIYNLQKLIEERKI